MDDILQQLRAAAGERFAEGQNSDGRLLDEAANEIRRLRVEAKELRADKERMDWLDADLPDQDQRSFHWNRYYHESVRDALDEHRADEG